MSEKAPEMSNIVKSVGIIIGQLRADREELGVGWAEGAVHGRASWLDE